MGYRIVKVDVYCGDLGYWFCISALLISTFSGTHSSRNYALSRMQEVFEIATFK